MNLESIKKKALELKEKADKKTEELVEFSAKKLAESGATINSKNDLESFIQKSKNTTFKNSQTGIEKEYKKRSIVIFGDKKTQFFEDALYILPILWAKGFSQNTPLKLAASDIKNIKLSEYKVSEIPSMVVFENKKVYKVITGSENILKLVKTLDLDINKLIEKDVK